MLGGGGGVVRWSDPLPWVGVLVGTATWLMVSYYEPDRVFDTRMTTTDKYLFDLFEGKSKP